MHGRHRCSGFAEARAAGLIPDSSEPRHRRRPRKQSPEPGGRPKRRRRRVCSVSAQTEEITWTADDHVKTETLMQVPLEELPTSRGESVQETRERYERELFERVLPFWEANVDDNDYGGFLTMLDRDGSVYDSEKYMWMQWRVVYMFATLAHRFREHKNRCHFEKWLSLSENGFEWLLKKGKDKEGMYYFVLDRKGSPLSGAHNIFSEAFACMGSAALFQATKKQHYLEEALICMKIFVKRLDSPKGRWTKREPTAPPRRSLGPLMILANLVHILRSCCDISEYDSLLDDCLEMIVKNFWNPQFGVLFENINEDLTFDLESSEGRHINPGHGLETAWFILQVSKVERHRAWACTAIKSTLKFGWDTENGGIFYFRDVLDRPSHELTWNMKLWWVHCEALVACLCGYEASGDLELLRWFHILDRWTWAHFPDQENMEWFGYLDKAGCPTHFLKGGRWKTFFHLPRALLKCADLLQHVQNDSFQASRP